MAHPRSRARDGAPPASSSRERANGRDVSLLALYDRATPIVKRVLSFCLWGDEPCYWKGAIENARLAAVLFPGWTCRYTIAAGRLPGEALASLEQLPNTELVVRNQDGAADCMLWRFEAADDRGVEVMVSRDADSRLSERERLAVEAWLGSGRKFHVMRDHPDHGYPMLGGMWGMRGGWQGRMLRKMNAFLASWQGDPRWGQDQDFLAARVWPAARRDVLVHDPFFEGRPFPDPRRDPEGVYFVGERFTPDNRPAFQADRDAVDRHERRSRWRRGSPFRRRHRFPTTERSI